MISANSQLIAVSLETSSYPGKIYLSYFLLEISIFDCYGNSNSLKVIEINILLFLLIT